MKTTIKLVLAAAVSVAFAGCAALKRGAATERYCEDHSKDHVYDKPLEDLKSQVTADLMMHRPIDAPPGSPKPGFSSKVSYHVDQNAQAPVDDDQHFIMKGSDAVYEAIRVSPVTTRVQITSAANGQRLFDREWLFLKRVEPNTAAKIIADADSHIDENGNPK